MIGFLYAGNNDIQHAPTETLISSSIYTGGNSNGFYITRQNLLQASVVFAVRRIVKHSWIKHNDQFLQPNLKSNAELDKNFISNCLVYMLFDGKNLTASALNLPYLEQNYSLTNNFLPFSEKEVGATGRFKSNFLLDFIESEKIKFTPEAQKVMDCALEVWQLYFKTNFAANIKKEYKLLNEKGEMLPDVGWYQVRKSLEAHEKEISGNGKSSKALKTYFTPKYTAFQTAYQNLVDEILPKVYEYEFLKK